MTYLLIVRPKVTWTSAIRVFLTHLNTAELKAEGKESGPRSAKTSGGKEERSLTSSEFEDFSDEHEAGFSQGVSPAVALVTVVGQVAVVVSLLLPTSMATSRGHGGKGCSVSRFRAMMLELRWSGYDAGIIILGL